MVTAVAVLVFVPALIAFGVSDLPSIAEVRASHTADIFGVWLITWGLIALGVIGALTVSWLAWTADAEAQRLAEPTRNMSYQGMNRSDPGVRSERFSKT
jgi:uncharacterized iron-regulated membrane protein